MVLDASLLIIQHYKIRIKGKAEQSMERSSALTDSSVLELMKKKPSGHPQQRSPTLLIYIYIYIYTYVALNRARAPHTHTYIYIYIYVLQQFMVITISLDGLVVNQTGYNLEGDRAII